MDALAKMREFVSRYPEAEVFESFTIDYTDNVPDNGGLFPTGLVEVSRTKDLLGNATVRNQYNFALYTLFTKAPGDDLGATYNAEWVMGFQEWVQEQSALGLAPTFGDVPREESITAENGQVHSADEEGTALYVVQLQVNFTREFRS